MVASRALTAVALMALLAVCSAQTTRTAPAPAPACSTVAQVATQAGGLNTLVAALNAANLTSTFNDPSLYGTVFAPTDSAFAVLFQALNITAQQALASRTLLTPILLNHFVPGISQKLAAFQNGQVLGTSLGRNATVTISIPTAAPAAAPATAPAVAPVTTATTATAGRKLLQAVGTNVFVLSPQTVARNGAAQVLIADIPACQSYIHVVDAVLVPSAQVINSFLG